MMCMHRRGG